MTTSLVNRECLWTWPVPAGVNLPAVSPVRCRIVAHVDPFSLLLEILDGDEAGMIRSVGIGEVQLVKQ